MLALSKKILDSYFYSDQSNTALIFLGVIESTNLILVATNIEKIENKKISKRTGQSALQC